MRLRIGTALLGLMLVTAACGGEATPSGSGGGEGDGALTFWSLEDNQDRIEATQAIAERFTEETGIEVDLVAIGEADFSTQVTSAVAGGTMPDVFGALSLGFTHSLATDGLADQEANAAVVEALGADTFSQSAIDLVTTEDGLAGVPSDSWAQLLVYRTDLFEAAGLE
ncbi:MAG: ABC transporter substrate-binding protein, partial [Candidatus Limnocylindria bacterium]